MDSCKNGHKDMSFVDSKGSKDCIECRRQRYARYRDTKHDNVIASQQAWYRGNTEKAKANSAIKHDRKYFDGLREFVIARDGSKCIECHMTRDEHQELYNRDITVDHIDKNGTRKPKHLRNNNPTNLQTLCLKCHSSKDRKLTLAGMK